MSDETKKLTNEAWLRIQATEASALYTARIASCADELAELREAHSECDANEAHFERALAELRKEVERLEAQLSISDKARAETWQQLAEANAALLRNGSSCELCGDPVPKGAAYCSECWLPP